MRVAVIGAGLFGSQHAAVYSALPSVDLVAIVDADIGAARTLAATSRSPTVASPVPGPFPAPEAPPGPLAFGSVDELWAAGPDLDAVSVATPDHTHGPIVEAAIDQGLHVLCEKPLATSSSEAQRLVEAAEARGVTLAVDFHNRVNPAIAGARETLADGQLGAARHVTAQLSNKVAVPRDMLSWAAHSSALWFLGSHVVDALRFVLDDEVARVYAVSRRGGLAGIGVDTDDFHYSILEFWGGTVAFMENSWILPDADVSPFSFKLDITATRGAIRIDTSHRGVVRTIGPAGIEHPDVLGITPSGPGRVAGFVHEAIARFVDTVIDGAPPLATGADGLAASRVLEAIERSAAEGEPVDLG